MGNQEVFDGLEISLYDGKFSGAFDLDAVTASGISLDDEVSFIVTAHVSGANIGETRNGEIKRTNVFKVVGASLITPQKKAQIQSSLSQFSQPVRPADEIQPDGKPAWATAETGSLFEDEEELTPEQEAQAAADGWGGQDINPGLQIILPDEEEEDFQVFTPDGNSYEDDREVFGKPIAYKDPILARMLEQR